MTANNLPTCQFQTGCSTPDPTNPKSRIPTPATSVYLDGSTPVHLCDKHYALFIADDAEFQHCVLCGVLRLTMRAPSKGYSVAGDDCYCEACFTKTFRTTVMEYGCLPERIHKRGQAPINPGYEGFDRNASSIGSDHIRLATLLWNALVKITRDAWALRRKLTTDPQLEADLKIKQDALDQIDETVQKQKARERTKKVAVDPALKQLQVTLKAERKVITDALKAARTQMKVVNAAALKQLEEDVKIQTEAALQASGLNHTMRNPLHERFKTTVKTTAAKTAQIIANKLAQGRSLTGYEGCPNFQRYDGTGIITQPFTNGLSLDKAFGLNMKKNGQPDTCNQFQIGPVIHQKKSGAETRICKVAVTTDANRQPVWATVPAVFHRPIPQGADIRHVNIVRDKVAKTMNTTLGITLRVRRPEPKQGLACAIDIGWRKTLQGIRVAYLYDQNRVTREFILPQLFMDGFRKVDDLSGIIRRAFDECRDELAPWFKANVATIPPVVYDACVSMKTGVPIFSMAQWDSPGKMVRLMRIWEANRFPGDQQMFDRIRYWYYGDPNRTADHRAWKGTDSWSVAGRTRAGDKPNLFGGHLHLWEYQAHYSDQLQKRRRELYRVWAAELGRQYATIYLEEFDLRKVIMKPGPIEATLSTVPTAQEESAAWQRTKAALSVFRGALETMGEREGIRVTQEPGVLAEDTTHYCPECWEYVKFNAASDLLATCGNCGKTTDQDLIGAYNVLRRGEKGLMGATA